MSRGGHLQPHSCIRIQVLLAPALIHGRIFLIHGRMKTLLKQPNIASHIGANPAFLEKQFGCSTLESMFLFCPPQWVVICLLGFYPP